MGKRKGHYKAKGGGGGGRYQKPHERGKRTGRKAVPVQRIAPQDDGFWKWFVLWAVACVGIAFIVRLFFVR